MVAQTNKIPATWEAEIVRIPVWVNPRQKVSKIPPQQSIQAWWRISAITDTRDTEVWGPERSWVPNPAPLKKRERKEGRKEGRKKERKKERKKGKENVFLSLAWVQLWNLHIVI
jgi:hypothetical protein